MSRPSQAAVKVTAETRDRVRIAAAVTGRSQSEVVAAAVSEYVQRHADELRQGLAAAEEALSLGKDATLAYMTGASVEDIRRVTGGSAPSDH